MDEKTKKAYENVKKFRETAGYRSMDAILKIANIEIAASILPRVDSTLPMTWMVRICREGKYYYGPHAPYEEELQDWRQENSHLPLEKYCPNLADFVATILTTISLAVNYSKEDWANSQLGHASGYEALREEFDIFKSFFDKKEFEYLVYFLAAAQVELVEQDRFDEMKKENKLILN